MLSIKGLTHVYPNGTRALDNVALEIGKEKIVKSITVPASGTAKLDL